MLRGRICHWLLAIVFALLLAASVAPAKGLRPSTWRLIPHRMPGLHGQIVDFTANHGQDCRIYSKSLDQKRDLYVYLPPHYDCHRQYPIMMYLHGFAQDEKAFLDIVPLLDKAIACGQIPPMIIAAPDGSIPGTPSIFRSASFYVNSRAGCFEDFIECDVWNFVTETFPIRPERESHLIAGGSMGGFGAYNHAIKYRERYKLVAGMLPPLNVRYSDCHGRYFADFDPNCEGIRERVKPFQPVARFYLGALTVRQRLLTRPLYGVFERGVIDRIAGDNPMEMLETYDVKPGELDMYIGYGGKDEFNIDAQVESFVYHAKQRCIYPTVIIDPDGRHNSETGKRLFPSFANWISQRVN